MCSFIDRFPAYMAVILRCIQSCENKLQLMCVYDMIDRFQEHFRMNVPPAELKAAADKLYEAYAAKDAVTHFFQ